MAENLADHDTSVQSPFRQGPESQYASNTPDNSLKSATDSLEKQMILSALEEAKGNVSQAAVILNMKRPTLQYKMKRYGISKANLNVFYKF